MLVLREPITRYYIISRFNWNFVWKGQFQFFFFFEESIQLTAVWYACWPLWPPLFFYLSSSLCAVSRVVGLQIGNMIAQNL